MMANTIDQKKALITRRLQVCTNLQKYSNQHIQEISLQIMHKYSADAAVPLLVEAMKERQTHMRRTIRDISFLGMAQYIHNTAIPLNLHQIETLIGEIPKEERNRFLLMCDQIRTESKVVSGQIDRFLLKLSGLSR